ncbi:MAG TPA: hypothetical protein VG097_18235 [Gemmata sp.]|nr:hypothetical protein [Gemmata sp.]
MVHPLLRSFSLHLSVPIAMSTTKTAAVSSNMRPIHRTLDCGTGRLYVTANKYKVARGKNSRSKPTSAKTPGKIHNTDFDLGNSVDVTEARDAEEQKTRNRSLAIGPLIFYPDGAG